jgi:hypothetical protein
MQGIDRLIKEGEILWTNNPNPYLDFAMQATMKLGDSKQLGNSNRIAVLAIFDNVMEKKSPREIIDASNYFSRKNMFILKYFGWPEISRNQTRLLKVARFIGEARTNMIAGFVVPPKSQQQLLEEEFPAYFNGFHSPDNLPPIIPPIPTNTPEQLLAATNTFQSVLVDVSNSLMPCLLDYCSRFPSSNPTNADFIKAIISTAHLNDEEGRKLYRTTQ